MRGKRFFWKATGAFAIIVIAGCGAETQAPSSVVATASKPVATTPAPTAPDKYESSRYCQQLDERRMGNEQLALHHPVHAGPIVRNRRRGG